MTKVSNGKENFNPLSRVHGRYRPTDDRRTCDSKDPNVTWSRSSKRSSQK